MLFMNFTSKFIQIQKIKIVKSRSKENLKNKYFFKVILFSRLI